MAVDKPIDFIDPKGETVIWNETRNNQMVLPFTTSTASSQPRPNTQPVSDKENHAILA